MAIAMLLLVLYNLGVMTLACYMTVNHGWYWIFLLLFVGGKVKSEKEE